MILPARMHEVQTCTRRGEPFTRARTLWMFGFQRRLVRLCEWLRRIPNEGCLPHMSQTAAMARASSNGSRDEGSRLASSPMEALRRLRPADLASVMRVYRDLLRSHQESINRLNVYPVPDGDTGTNMALTLESVVAELDDDQGASDHSLPEVCSAIAHGSLMGAQGELGGDPVAAAAGHLGRARPEPTVEHERTEPSWPRPWWQRATRPKRPCCALSRGRSSPSPARPGKVRATPRSRARRLIEVAEQARERGCGRSGQDPRAAPRARESRRRRRRGKRATCCCSTHS